MPDTLTTEQIDKVGNTVIYLSTRVGELMKTKLLKIIFLLEEWSIQRFGHPFFNLDFKAWQFGPVVEPIYKEVDEGRIEIFKNYFRKNQWDEFEAVAEFNDDEFSPNEIRLLDEMVAFAKHKTGHDFIEITHREGSLWEKTATKYGI